MRLLILSQYFWPESFIINDLANSLQAKGHNVEVLTAQPNYPGGRVLEGYGSFKIWREQRHGIKIMRVPIWPRRSGSGINLILNYLSFVFSAIAFGLPRISKYDAVLVFAPSPIIQVIPAIILKWITGVRIHLWVQDLWPESLRAVGVVRSERVLRFIESCVGWMYRRCDSVFIQSEAFHEQVERLSHGKTRIEYVPNWAEAHYRVLESFDRKSPELPDGFRVMYAGNLGKAQSLETIAKAAKLLTDLTDLKWVIIGDGREREAFEQEIRKNGLMDRFTFLGRKPSADMPEYLSKADALLVTLRDDPTFAMTVPSRVQAYLACGRPLVAALNGEGNRIVREANAGIVCSAEAADCLADGIRHLYGLSVEEREQYGKSAARYSDRHFARDRVMQKIEALLKPVQGQT